MLLFGFPPRLNWITTIQSTCDLPKLLLNGAELPQCDREQTIGADVDAVLEFQLPLETFASETERRLRPRREICLEVVDVRLDRRRRFGGCIREVTENT